jgi:hypothetical protein
VVTHTAIAVDRVIGKRRHAALESKHLRTCAHNTRHPTSGSRCAGDARSLMLAAELVKAKNVGDGGDEQFCLISIGRSGARAFLNR